MAGWTLFSHSQIHTDEPTLLSSNFNWFVCWFATPPNRKLQYIDTFSHRFFLLVYLARSNHSHVPRKRNTHCHTLALILLVFLWKTQSDVYTDWATRDNFHVSKLSFSTLLNLLLLLLHFDLILDTQMNHFYAVAWVVRLIWEVFFSLWIYITW